MRRGKAWSEAKPDATMPDWVDRHPFLSIAIALAIAMLPGSLLGWAPMPV